LVAAGLIVVACLAPIGALAQHGAEDLRALQDRIDAEGLEWTAGPTSMTELSEAEQRSMLMPPLAELGAPDLTGLSPAGSLGTRRPAPAVAPFPSPDDPVFTWQDVNGQDWTSPVTNQGQCGSCAIFAAVSTIEASLNVAFGDANLDYDLAEQYFLDCTPASCSKGTHHLVCLNQTLHFGVPDEICMPYVAADVDCAEKCDDADQRMARAAGWGWVADYVLDPPTDEQIKEAVALGPITTSMDVHSDYFWYVDGVYEPSEDAPVVGSHAVPIIGWNDEHDSWYCKNSWGTDWGQVGFFEIRRGAAGIGGAFTTWLEMDPSGITGSFDVSDDSVEAVFEQGLGGVDVQTVTLFRTAGESPVPFEIAPKYDASWLAIEPLEGAVGEEEVTVTFTFDESGYTQNPGAVTCSVEILGGHGLARAVEARIVVMPGDGQPDDTDSDTGPTPGADAGADGNGSGDGCDCGQPGRAAERPGLLRAALAALIPAIGR
jgi:hypothetical protein